MKVFRLKILMSKALMTLTIMLELNRAYLMLITFTGTQILVASSMLKWAKVVNQCKLNSFKLSNNRTKE